MTRDLICGSLDVSRETIDRLSHFEQTLFKWNPKINLVSKSSLQDFWTRHIVDSAQVFLLAEGYISKEEDTNWLDIGSGGGFPGLVIAILAAERATRLSVTLIESDKRKAAFLRTAARECGVRVKVISERIETVDPQNANFLSARALADLDLLFEFSERHLHPRGIALFPKGATWKKEVDNAARRWRFDQEEITSLTEEEAVVLKIKGVSRV